MLFYIRTIDIKSYYYVPTNTITRRLERCFCSVWYWIWGFWKSLHFYSVTGTTWNNNQNFYISMVDFLVNISIKVLNSFELIFITFYSIISIFIEFIILNNMFIEFTIINMFYWIHHTYYVLLNSPYLICFTEFAILNMFYWIHHS